MDSKNVIAAIALSSAVIVLYSLFFIPEQTSTNQNLDEKKTVIEALWTIIYSDEQADMYESNLMRRLSGLLYLDAKVVGDIKEKVKSNQ